MIEQGCVTSVSETLTEEHKTIGPMPFSAAPTAAVGAGDVVEPIETPGTVNRAAADMRYYTVVGVSRSRNRRGRIHGADSGVPLIDAGDARRTSKSHTRRRRSRCSGRRQAGDLPAVAPGGRSERTGAAGTRGAIRAHEAPGAPTHPRRIPGGTIARPKALPEWAAAGRRNRRHPGRARSAEIRASTGVERRGPRRRCVRAAPAENRIQRLRSGARVRRLRAVQRAALRGTKAAARNAPTRPSQPSAPEPALLTAPGFTDPTSSSAPSAVSPCGASEMTGTVAIESEATRRSASPRSTRSRLRRRRMARLVASEDGVSLIWEANGRHRPRRLRGLARRGPGETLAPLNPTPIRETTFRDAAVRRAAATSMPWSRSTATPPNRSPPSNRVTEAVR